MFRRTDGKRRCACSLSFRLKLVVSKLKLFPSDQLQAASVAGDIQRDAVVITMMTSRVSDKVSCGFYEHTEVSETFAKLQEGQRRHGVQSEGVKLIEVQFARGRLHHDPLSD